MTMQSLILAAGYATRLYPLTQNFPKPLLEIGKICILDRLISDLDKIETVSRHIIVTNDTFLNHFEKWKQNSTYQKEIVIINDGTINNENRLGAVGDILLVIDKLNIQDDLLILAGDNVVDFSFAGFVKYAQDKNRSCITCHPEPSIKALQKTGVLETNPEFRVIAIHEKPQNPPSHWAVPPFYYYQASDLSHIKKALDEGCGFDAPGNLAAWLCKQTEVFAWQLPGKRYDIGDLASYSQVNKLFSED